MKDTTFARNNNRKTAGLWLVMIILFSLLASACAPAAAPTTVVQVQKEVQVVKATQVVEMPKAAAPTALPAIAEAPRPQATRASLPVPGSKPTPVDNNFQNYGVNPYEDTLEDHLSTFALDVDTASYSVMRRYVLDGNLPPADAVRVEEYVNYFKQDYPMPGDVAFGIYADGAPSPFENNNVYLLRFGIQGYQLPAHMRKPASLTFVVDASGSMKMENRLTLVKDSLKLLVDNLNDNDTVAIVAYDTTARVVMYPTNGSERRAIRSAIDSISTGGSTNAEAGLQLGYNLAMQGFRSNATNRVILCSDGVANVGQTNADSILATVRGYVDEGILLSTVGVGMGNFNDVLLEQLADNGNGNYAYIDNLDQAHKIYVEDLISTLDVIALNAKVQVDFNPDVVAYYRLVGYENRAVTDQDFRNNSVDAGEIGPGHTVTAIYAVVMQQNAQGRLATVQMRWEDPQTHEVREINGNFNTFDLATSFSETSPRYQLAVAVTQFAEVLRQSPWAANTSLAQVYNLAAPLADSLAGDPDVAEFINLVSRANQIHR